MAARGSALASRGRRTHTVARVNYRHAFHVGNHADILKHVTLSLVLAHLRRKATPFVVLDTHAGRGRYALDGEEAQRSPEWRDGALRLWDWPDAPPELAPWREAVAACNDGGALTAYPGSPLIALAGMRAQDRLIACELHPEEAGALRRRLAEDRRAQVHERDGFEAMGALLPPPERRGLVLIDPPYEDRDLDMMRSVKALRHALGHFGYGAYVWWRPLKDLREVDDADAALAAGLTLKLLRADLAVDRPAPEGRLVASSVLVINPPYTLADQLQALLPALSQRLALSDKAGWRIV
jgi:23S rRNA (adenine2030-N6)-methyltransferase